MKKVLVLAGLMTMQSVFGLEVYFFRHGETTWNRARVLQGTLDFPRLTTNGRMMASDTAKGLKQAGITFDRAYTSPLLRARDTARLVCEPLGIVPIVDERLHEMEVGDIRGIRYDRKTCTNEQMKVFYENPSKFVARGPGAETTDMVGERIRDFIETELRPLEGKCNRVLCMVHAKVLYALARAYHGENLTSRVALQRNCCAHILELKDGKFVFREAGKVFYDLAKYDALAIPRCVAHRGAAVLKMNEASRAAYSNAVEGASDIVKLDIRRTRDGVPVMSHDPTLKRTMGWDVKICDLDYAEILEKGRFPPKNGFPEERIVRFDEAIEIVKAVPEMWLDFKDFTPELAERVLSECAKAGVDDSRLMIATFTTKALEYFQKNHPCIRRVGHIGFKRNKRGELVLSTEKKPIASRVQGVLDYCSKYGLFGVNLPVISKPEFCVTPDEVKTIRDAGYWASLWFVQKPEKAREYFPAGADAWVTDYKNVVELAR